MRYADPVAQAEIDRLQACINEALAHHKPENRNGLTYCRSCSGTFWPCGTAQALTGSATLGQDTAPKE